MQTKFYSLSNYEKKPIDVIAQTLNELQGEKRCTKAQLLGCDPVLIK